ncbi:OmpA family protein [Myxococcota bacterium]|nr:OmpA family protein [Myxococcota bacterium]
MNARSALFIAPLLFVASTASAADAIKVELIPKAQKGQGQPQLVVRAEVAIARLTLDVTRALDGKKLKLTSGALDAGDVHRFALELPKPAASTFEGKLSVQTKSGEKGEMPLAVSVELLAPLEVSVSAADVDLQKRELKLVASRPVKRVEIATMSDTGRSLGTSNTEDPKLDGDKAIATWDQDGGTVMKISVQAFDENGFFGGVDLFPWRVDIPHEEVHFRSGSFDVDANEGPKLASSYELIQAAIAKYGKLATIKLFIAGHTDTVGDAASNQTLSNNRARAIGRHFKKLGVKIPILYAGFGEELLLVQTPDETDEVKNRRAEYIVAVEAPTMKGAVRFVPLD